MINWKVIVGSAVLASVVALTGCQPTGTTSPAPTENTTLAPTFDPENAKEFGIRGAHVGEGIKEAMAALKPEKYEFMDMISRESLTVEQLAKGEGNITTGILFADQAQVLVTVQKGVVTSIMVGGIPQEQGDKFKTNRGLSMYESIDKVKQLYGDAAGDKELTYKGSKYQVTFSLNNNKVIGYRFDVLAK
ncbi:hypothetical protein [Brevibacillus laterosporus]|uniref:DUF4309 domain-containing protein n=1 Tax=Brevibacillus laterosporus TaxID=1465 RepID=A0AAP8U5K9_BRELA|nr:hypothetical protein [Brevibacillus laterosporus]ATO48164.1 hypothetical protein BrL25_02985 [Brevibacillus laterosporus DSM 25]AYB37062.1 hypothetical protein D5F52_01550 [Brevibacillus laterosporus]MBG9772521.1 hypothetical protein [Brevibacillus laterosporus]MBG9799907.1 hypothetical protein [Brevibacillus laterosporus]MBG9801828.1 hypothetical protein [Brevibacillus laterosporus]